MALAGAAAVALDACGTRRNHVKTDGPVPSADVPVLAALLNLEYMTIYAYEAGIPLLDPATAKAAQQFLPQEEAHAGELAGLIKKAKVKPPKPRVGYNLGHPRDAAQVLALLHRLESVQLTAYVRALPRLTGGPVRAALAAVFANDAQHVAILREQLGHSPAPAAFVTGRE